MRDMDITGLSIYGRKIGATKFSLFFGSPNTVSFQALVMDSMITFGSNFCLSHDTTLPYILSANYDLQVNERISELERSFYMKAGNVLSSAFDLSIQAPLEYHQ